MEKCVDKKRIEWVDLAKGYGIILVILSHCISINTTFTQLLFIFHVPLFFFLSGYVNKNYPPLMEIRKRLKSLLFPYLSFFVIGLAVTLTIPEWRNSLTLQGILNDLKFSNPISVHNSSIWFLFCLFWCCLIYSILSKFNSYIKWLFVLTLYFIGICNSRHLIKLNFLHYLALDVVPAAFIFYVFGYYFKLLKLYSKLIVTIIDELIVVLLCFIGIYSFHKFYGYVNIHGLQYSQNSVLYVISGLLGITMIVALSKMTARLPVKNLFRKAILFYGKNSLIIFGLQSLLICLYIPLIKRCTGKSLSLYNFPTKYALISLFLTIFLEMPIICILYSRIKYKLKTTNTNIKD